MTNYSLSNLEEDFPGSGAIAQPVWNLLQEYNLAEDSYGWNYKGGQLKFKLNCLPVLPFFTDLAELMKVELEHIHVDAESESTGHCDTCAGHTLVVTVTIV